MLKKSDIREQARRHRAAIIPQSGHYDRVVASFFETIAPAEGNIIAGYYPKGNEFDGLDILVEATKRGYRTCLPVIEGDQPLRFALWSVGDTLSESAFGIVQPEISESTEFVDPDYILMPALAFDKRGYRIGYGKGHYDRTLAALKERKTITAIVIGYAEQLSLFQLPNEDHDIPADWVLTPEMAMLGER